MDFIPRTKPLKASAAAVMAGVKEQSPGLPCWRSLKGHKKALALQPRQTEADHSNRPSNFAAAPAGRYPVAKCSPIGCHSF